MVSGARGQIHAQLGGYRPFRALQPNHRRPMYEIERANLISRRVMDADRYMVMIKQQNQTFAHGDDTDMDGIFEGGESEAAENDGMVEPHTNFTQAVEERTQQVFVAPRLRNGCPVTTLYHGCSGCH